MSTANQPSIDQIRAKARQIAARAERDPAFRQRLETDPIGALAAAGLRIEVEGGVEEAPEVAGYVACAVSYDAARPPTIAGESGGGPAGGAGGGILGALGGGMLQWCSVTI